MTETTSPAFQVGQTYLGSYEYDSPTVDGDFGTLHYRAFTNPSSLPTLRGFVYSFVVDPTRIEFDDNQFLTFNF